MSSSTAPGEVRHGQSARIGLLRMGAGLAGLFALQLIAHHAALASGHGPFLALTPLLLPGALAARIGFARSPGTGLLVLGVLAALAVVALLSPLVAHFVPLLAQLAICLAIAWLFGHTLAPGAVPLVTQMARAVRGSLPPAIETYTRNVTVVWTLYLLALGCMSALLFLYAPLRTWSLFANVLLLPLVGGMFLAEYAYRVTRYRSYPHATLVQSVLAFERLRAARRAAR